MAGWRLQRPGEIVTPHSTNPAYIGASMPSLVRFLVVVAILVAVGAATVIYLADFVQPRTRSMTIRIPPAKLGVEGP